MTRHVSTYSLGGGSWLTASIVEGEFVKPGDEHLLVFTDTLYEDADAYRFGLQAACHLFGRRADWVPAAEDFPDYRVEITVPIWEYAGNPQWRAFLAQLRDRAAETLPELVWIVEGRDPWEVYRDERFLGNSRIDPCSKVAKREALDRWMVASCEKSSTVVYFGIGQAERHRFEEQIGPRWWLKGWTPRAPLIDRDFEGNVNPTWFMEQVGLRPPRLYGFGYDHNNCGGKCCKAGKRHWLLRLRVQPERFAYDALMERKVRAFLGQDVAFLTDRRGEGPRRPMTLDALAAEAAADPDAPLPPREEGDGGCGCMADAYEDAEVELV